ncbi:hypothetical protein C6P40_001784 [Pichia californica]|uniref:Charged multivesicular body protein 7 n=1 Tax=Pichia californica TaxID=460514 RepID=A0A9P7BFP3_9ASCO|nr:hypothetical protein C6P42_000818 [[Candida] californica]KAG0687844.1 hypothetical protein C6P40_001784 [[Candida] californica]
MENINKLYESNPEFRESRLKSLFSDYSSLKESNPEGYNANINVWKNFLSLVLSSQYELTFNYNSLQKDLIYKKNSTIFKPEGLFIALNEMLNSDKSIIFSSQIEYFKKEEANNSNIFSIIRAIIFGVESLDIRKKKYINQSLIFVSKIDKYSQKVNSHLTQLLKHGPINVKHLQNVLSTQNFKINEDDLVITLSYLCQDYKGLNIADGVIYVDDLKEENNNNENDKEKVDIDVLKHISDLNYTIYKLNLYNDEKLKEISKIDESIKQSLKNNNKITAKSQLKLKKTIEFQVKKTLSSLENLNLLKVTVEDAQNNLLISKVWKDNSNVLKFLNENTTKTNLDDNFDVLYDEIQTTNMISEKLGQNLVSFDDEEINQQLSDLEASISKNEEENKKNLEVDEVRKKLDSLKIPDNELKTISKQQEDNENKYNKKIAIFSE